MPYPIRASGSGRKQHDRSGIKKFLAVVLPDSEDIESHAIRRLDLLEQVPETDNGIDLYPGHRISGCRDKAVDPDLHI